MGDQNDSTAVTVMPDGTEVVVGELWAACPSQGGEKVRIDPRVTAYLLGLGSEVERMEAES